MNLHEKREANAHTKDKDDKTKFNGTLLHYSLLNSLSISLSVKCRCNELAIIVLTSINTLVTGVVYLSEEIS